MVQGSLLQGRQHGAGYWAYPFKSTSTPTGDAPAGGANSENGRGSNGYAVTQSHTLDPGQVYLYPVTS